MASLLYEHQVASRGRRIESDAPLAGLLFDDRGNRMSPTWTSRRGGRYRYYVSQALLQGRNAEAGSRPRVSAVDLETMVFAAVAERVRQAEAGGQGLGAGEGTEGDDSMALQALAPAGAMEASSASPSPDLDRQQEGLTAVVSRTLDGSNDEAANTLSEINGSAVEAIAKARVWARALARGTIKDFAELAALTGHSE